MKSVAALSLLAGSAAAFAPTPVAKVGTALNYASELDSMPTSVECPKVVCSVLFELCTRAIIKANPH